MTSDQSSSGDAEMQLSNTPVTPPKSAGLNPNANVFQSKGATTPPEQTSDWPEVDPANGNVINGGGGYAYVNGDIGKVPAGVSFPPTPESPNTMQITTTTDYTSMNGASVAGDVLFPSDQIDENAGALEDTIPEDQLRSMLKTQLEYYFCRENLASDSYLVSQMDADQYVPISTVAGFNQVKRLTTNMDLVVQALRESPNVQVDETGEKVRPLHKRCVVILREVPDSTPVEDVENLFSGKNCPKFISCEFAHNSNWYVTFDSDEDAQRAYQYLREEVCMFLGKPIMARIKAKPLLRSSFIPKNGFKQGVAPATQGQIPQQAPPTSAATFTSSADNQFSNAKQFTFTQTVPNVSQGAQFIVGQQSPAQPHQAQAATVASYPFFPPNNATVMHSWPGTPMPFFDPGTVSRCLDAADQLIHAFAANGYTPTATFKINNTQSRHGFQNMRNRNINKSHSNRHNQSDRQGMQEGRGSHDRGSHERYHQGPSISRSNSRGSDVSHSRRDRASSGDISGHSHATSGSHHHHGGAVHSSASSTHSNSTANAACGTTEASNGEAAATKQADSLLKDQSTQPPKYPVRPNYRSRRRRDDDGGAKTSNRGTSQPLKDAKASAEASKFELEPTSFPPLPGSTNSTTTGDVFENKMSDVVKGTAKPLTRESKPATQTTTTTSTTNTTGASTGTSSALTSASLSQSQSQSSTKQAVTSQSAEPASTLPDVAQAVATSADSSVVPPTATASTSTPAAPKASSSSSKPAATLPSPPLSPPSQKANSATIVDGSSSLGNSKTVESNTSTSKNEIVPDKQEEKGCQSQLPIAPKLTYAQMLQRKQMASAEVSMTEPVQEAAAASQLQSSNGTSNIAVMNGLPPASNGGNKPTALREQTQASRAAPVRGTEPYRKEDTVRDQRFTYKGQKTAKENRDRRDFRDYRNDRDRFRSDNDRFRVDRRRDRDYDSVRGTTSK